MSEISASVDVTPVDAPGRFDDRVDLNPYVTNREAFRIIGRSFRYLSAVKGLFLVKLGLALVASLPGLFAPWIGKILIDQVIIEQAAQARGVIYNQGDLFHSSADGSHTLRLTYSTASPPQIESGLKILGELIRDRWPGRSA